MRKLPTSPAIAHQNHSIMKYALLFLSVLLAAFAGMAQTGSEIYLFDLSVKKEKISMENPVNITNHPGYDNQPSFHPDQPIIYYSSFDAEGRADIRSYNYKTKASLDVTKTPEREYSPTVTPDQGHLSCIIQRDNNAQDLGKYTLDGKEPTVIIDNLTVGYHVWADNSHLALFVLGTPNTLHYLRLPTQSDTIVAEGIGRSLHKVPGEPAISFVHKISNTLWMIKKLNTHTMTVSDVTPTIQDREDLCWLPDGRILMSDGTKLYFITPGQETPWKEVRISKPMPALKGITRLAISTDGKKLAVVVSEN